MPALYKPKALSKPSSVRVREVYFDELRFAEGSGGYNIVDPATAK